MRRLNAHFIRFKFAQYFFEGSLDEFRPWQNLSHIIVLLFQRLRVERHLAVLVEEVVTVWAPCVVTLSIFQFGLTAAVVCDAANGVRAHFRGIFRRDEPFQTSLAFEIAVARRVSQHVARLWAVLFLALARENCQVRFNADFELFIVNFSISIHVKASKNCDQLCISRHMSIRPQEALNIILVKVSIRPIINSLERLSK